MKPEGGGTGVRPFNQQTEAVLFLVSWFCEAEQAGTASAHEAEAFYRQKQPLHMELDADNHVSNRFPLLSVEDLALNPTSSWGFRRVYRPLYTSDSLNGNKRCSETPGPHIASAATSKRSTCQIINLPSPQARTEAGIVACSNDSRLRRALVGLPCYFCRPLRPVLRTVFFEYFLGLYYNTFTKLVRKETIEFGGNVHLDLNPKPCLGV